MFIKSAGGMPIETLLSLLIVCILAYQTITDLIPRFPSQSACFLIDLTVSFVYSLNSAES